MSVLIHMGGALAVGLAGGIWIGRKLAIRRMIRAIQGRLVVLNVIEDEDDRDYHEKFQHCWHRGEWFTPSADLLELIQSLDTFTGWVTRKSLRDKMRLYEAICR